MHGRRWTKDEDAALLDGIGVFSIAWFRKRSGQSYQEPNAPLRSRKSIYERATRLIGSGSLTRGTYTLTGAARETGYAVTQIKRAQVALNQKWKRLSPRGPFLITFDQLDEIIGWLRKDYWCQKLRLYGCVNCGDNHRPSEGMGLCPRCYHRIRQVLRAAGLPSRMTQLLQVLQNLEIPYEGARGLISRVRAQLERGWSITEDQIMELLEIQDRRLSN